MFWHRQAKIFASFTQLQRWHDARGQCILSIRPCARSDSLPSRIFSLVGAGLSCSEARESTSPNLKLDTCLSEKTAERQRCSRGLTVVRGEEGWGPRFPPAPLNCLCWDRGKETPQTTGKGELKPRSSPRIRPCSWSACCTCSVFIDHSNGKKSRQWDWGENRVGKIRSQLCNTAFFYKDIK